ncbi:MAG: hypothetical protein RJB26_869, partial [Pseudomonadota bacterium]
MGVRLLVGASLLATLAAHAAPAQLDPEIQRITEQARSAYLATQSFKRLNLAVWVQAAPGAPWRGGEVDAEAQVYPASMVKLPYAIDSVLTCSERSAPLDCQRDDLVPMLVDSDNVATGRLVDGLTATRNYQSSPIPADVQALPTPADTAEREAAFSRWLTARLHTEARLQTLGLLGHMRLLHKTYPTNSGEEPFGFEAKARAEHGRNSMSAHDIAALMRALVDGEIDRATKVPVLETLHPYLVRSRYSLQSALASGAPPATNVIGKMGTAYDTLQEVAVLSWPQDPSKPRVLIAAFSDGLDQDTPEPFDGWRLAGLTTELLTRLKLMPLPQWQAPSLRRGTVARWQRSPGKQPQTLEVQYRINAAAAGLRRVHLHCNPGCSSN